VSRLGESEGIQGKLTKQNEAVEARMSAELRKANSTQAVNAMAAAVRATKTKTAIRAPGDGSNT
jgi:hypothetical protein